MFKVYLTNFGIQVGHDVATLEEAVQFCKNAGFECTIVQNGELFGKYSTISGFSKLIFEVDNTATLRYTRPIVRKHNH